MGEERETKLQLVADLAVMASQEESARQLQHEARKECLELEQVVRNAHADARRRSYSPKADETDADVEVGASVSTAATENKATENRAGKGLQDDGHFDPEATPLPPPSPEPRTLEKTNAQKGQGSQTPERQSSPMDETPEDEGADFRKALANTDAARRP